MSHEIRTPLNSVLALSQLLRDGMAGTLSNDQRKYLEVIERNGQNLLRLINDILDLSRIEAGHLEIDLQPVDIGAQIRAAVSALVPLAEAKGLDLQARIPDGLPAAQCDPDRVGQILNNLIGNAIKFTEAGQVQVSAELRGDRVAVAVTDTGIGIPEGARAKVFEEFYQVDQSLARRRGGTGLGLAIASRLARMMDGEISVESVVGSGSRFTFTLPRSAVAVAERRADAGAAALAPLDGRQVLLVGDDETERRRLAALLAETGVRVEVAATSEDVLARLRRSAPRFDAVVVDLCDGEGGRRMGGMEVVRAAGRDPQAAKIPFVALTERDLSIGEREALGPPVLGVVRKGDALRVALGAMLRKVMWALGPQPVAAPLPPRGTSILLVEDNEDNLFTLRQVLGSLGVELASAGSGREAIEYCRRRLPDLIIMDVQMPGMSGLQATGAIRALPGGRTIPIIALTAQAMKGDRERILAAGCDDYLPKPIQPRALLALVKQRLRREADSVEGGGVPRPSGEEEHGTHTPGR
jgi:CheY-like chemotaxis protein